MSKDIPETKTGNMWKMSAKMALKAEAHRLRNKADLLEKLADETDGKLSDEAELMLWSLVVNKA